MTEWPLEIPTGRGRQFLEHPLLRGGFLDDVYECFEDPSLAETFMTELSADTESFTPCTPSDAPCPAGNPHDFQE